MGVESEGSPRLSICLLTHFAIIPVALWLNNLHLELLPGSLRLWCILIPGADAGIGRKDNPRRGLWADFAPRPKVLEGSMKNRATLR